MSIINIALVVYILYVIGKKALHWYQAKKEPKSWLEKRLKHLPQYDILPRGSHPHPFSQYLEEGEYHKIVDRASSVLPSSALTRLTIEKTAGGRLGNGYMAMHFAFTLASGLDSVIVTIKYQPEKKECIVSHEKKHYRHSMQELGYRFSAINEAGVKVNAEQAEKIALAAAHKKGFKSHIHTLTLLMPDSKENHPAPVWIVSDFINPKEREENTQNITVNAQNGTIDYLPC